jgi:hypothetical protein
MQFFGYLGAARRVGAAAGRHAGWALAALLIAGGLTCAARDTPDVCKDPDVRLDACGK